MRILPLLAIRRKRMSPKPWRACWLAVIAALLSVASSARPAEKPPLYQGKTLNIVINFRAGGPTDIESRIFARHLSRHIPGAPTITIQNMGGGGGLTAVNYIGEVAKPDGFTAAYFTGALFQHQIKDPALRVDIGKFGFIRRARSHRFLHPRRRTARNEETFGFRQGPEISRCRTRDK